MFVLLSIPAGLLIGYLTGGKIGKSPNVDVRGVWLPLSALTLQVLLFASFSPVAHLSPYLKAIFHLVSYLLLLVFLAFNLKITGVAIIGLGMVLNLIAILANGGFMPTTARALALAGLKADGHRESQGALYNNVVTDNPRLLVLGDIFAIPKGMPMSNVFSIGDLIIGLGATIAVASAFSREASVKGAGVEFAPSAPARIESKERLLRGR
ncbi:MAG: DUF5317 domain-containing protein [Actinobacteria bacterium]|nr:DUF5317 domain-containing protein [Actinomycetota bacterium]